MQRCDFSNSSAGSNTVIHAHSKFTFFKYWCTLLQYSRTNEERGVQHRSLVLILILLIPADLRSYLRSTGGHESSAMPKFFLSKMHHTTMSFQICPYNSNFQPGMFLKHLEIPAWPFFGDTFFGAREYCSSFTTVSVVYIEKNFRAIAVTFRYKPTPCARTTLVLKCRGEGACPQTL